MSERARARSDTEDGLKDAVAGLRPGLKCSFVKAVLGVGCGLAIVRGGHLLGDDILPALERSNVSAAASNTPDELRMRVGILGAALGRCDVGVGLVVLVVQDRLMQVEEII